jgi:probable HAF family extracellular repeat protein
MIDLHSPFLPGNTNAGAFAYGLNDHLQIAGYGPRPVGSGHGFLYDYVGGSVADVGDLGGANGSVARAVNAAGQVTGWAYIHNNLWVHAYRFDGRIHDLGTLGGRNSQGLAINRSGQIVGRSEYEGANAAPHAFLYADGQMIDLNATLPADSGWTLREATGINDRGQIVGTAYWHGMGRGFLLTPLPSLQLRLAVGSGLVVIWGIENQNFVLQENSALTPTGWATVEVKPLVVGNEVRVALPQPPDTRFYRLTHP